VNSKNQLLQGGRGILAFAGSIFNEHTGCGCEADSETGNPRLLGDLEPSVVQRNKLVQLKFLQNSVCGDGFEFTRQKGTLQQVERDEAGDKLIYVPGQCNCFNNMFSFFFFCLCELDL